MDGFTVFPSSLPSSSGYVISGNHGSNTASFVFELDQSGKELWRRDFPNVSDLKIAKMTDGHYLGAGFDSERRLEVVRINPEGRTNMMVTYSLVESGYPFGLAGVEGGGAIIAVTHGSGIELLRIKSDGSIVWDKVVGAEGKQTKMQSIIRTRYNRTVLLGTREWTEDCEVATAGSCRTSNSESFLMNVEDKPTK
jgi:hypothetical protein